MKRLEYVCTSCGKPFGRKFVANRHLVNIHGGKGAITSTMDYMLGAVQGRYSWPSLPQNGNQTNNRRTTKTSIKDYLDTMHQFFQVNREFRELNSKPAYKNDIVPQPNAELLIGFVCQKCCARGVFPLVNPYESPAADQFHKCQAEQIASIIKENISNDELTWKGLKGLPDTIKSIAEDWVKNEKYLSALKLGPDDLQSLSPNVWRQDVYLGDLRKSVNTPHYLLRAVDEAEKNIWTPIDDHEMLDLVSTVQGTGAAFTFWDENKFSGSYLITLVPPHKIAEKKRNDELAWLKNQLSLGP